jgi:hypothetical protein
LAADAGFTDELNLKQLSKAGIDAYFADGQMRKRDPKHRENLTLRISFD